MPGVRRPTSAERGGRLRELGCPACLFFARCALLAARACRQVVRVRVRVRPRPRAGVGVSREGLPPATLRGMGGGHDAPERGLRPVVTLGVGVGLGVGAGLGLGLGLGLANLWASVARCS